MRFRVDDSVRITEDADFGDDHVAKGTKGKVTEVLHASNAYRVRFNGMDRDVIAIESVLEVSSWRARRVTAKRKQPSARE
jgi:hypothetical protein